MNGICEKGLMKLGNLDRYKLIRYVALILVALACVLPSSAQEPDTLSAEPVASEAAPEESPWYDNELLFFLGRFHPIVLHFPIALIVVLLMAEVLTLFLNHTRETSVTKWLLLIVGSVTAVTAATFGVFLSWSGGYDPDLTWWHKWLGIAVAVLMVLATLLKLGYDRLDTARFRYAYWVVLLCAVGVMFPASHYGASMTHGSTWLTKYLPPELEFLKPILGEGAEPTSSEMTEGLFAQEIQPILEAKCYECHNADKQDGDYRMDDLEWLVVGGESERAAIVPSDAMTSHLVELILLPEENEDVMPPYGKPKLESAETIAIIQWINRGAPLGDYVPPAPEVKEKAEIDLASADSDAAGAVPISGTDELMETLFEPLIEELRLSLVVEPKGRRALKAVYNPAAAIAETHNLLFSRDDEDYMATPEWTVLSIAGRDASTAVADAVMGQDYPGTKAAFVTLVKTCNECHVQFDDSIDTVDDVIPAPEESEDGNDE
jgi:uncharacterized membrane protein